MPTMANEKAAPAFMNLPLEVRHTIFEYVAARDFKPKKLLRYWFEKKEIKKLVEQAATNNPNGPTPRVVYDDYDDYDDDYDESAVADGDGEDDDDEENENVEEDSENEDESEGEDESEDEGAEQDEDSDEDEDGAGIEGEDDDEDEEPEEAVDGAQNAQPATAQVTAQVNPDNQPADDMGEDAGQAHVDGDEHDGEAEGALANTGEEGEDDDDEDLANGEVSTGTAVAAIQPPPVFRPQPKWRHIPNFMRLTQCPPPVQLLLTSQQLNNEAKNWFYDVAILRIDATGSFAHTSFFEEAFGQITDAAFSPMENIRKVDVTFVWDSTWIRADKTDCVEAIFPALLRQRSSFVYQILLQAPDLREVVIHWHDSVRDDESTNLMLDNLAPFHTLSATVKIIEHYIQADATPKKRSVAGKRRIEFQNILDMGLDRLF